MRLLLPLLLLVLAPACVFKKHARNDTADTGAASGIGDFGGNGAQFYEHDCGQDGQTASYAFTFPITVTPGEMMPEAVTWSEISPAYKTYVEGTQPIQVPSWYASWGISTDEAGRVMGNCLWYGSPIDAWYADRVVLVLRAH